MKKPHAENIKLIKKNTSQLMPLKFAQPVVTKYIGQNLFSYAFYPLSLQFTKCSRVSKHNHGSLELTYSINRLAIKYGTWGT